MTTSSRLAITLGLVATMTAGEGGNNVAMGQAAPPARAARPDLCALLTEAEAEAVVGKPLASPQRQKNGDCWYLQEGGKDFGDVELILSVLPVRIASEGEFDRFIAQQVAEMNQSLEKSGLKGDFTAERVPGLGGAAHYVDPSLFVLVGQQVLGIVAPKPQAAAIAAKAVPRLGR